MSDSLVDLVYNIFLAVAIGAVGYLAAWIAARVIKRFLTRFLSPSWSGFLANMAALGIILLAIKIIVDLTGATGAFVIIITALTGAFAIGSNDVAADLVSGVKMLFLKYYDVGDMVTIAGHTGQVEDVNMTNTVLATRRRDHVIIPNSQALGQIIVNHSKVPGHIVSVQIPIPGEHDRDKIMGIMLETAQAFPARRGSSRSSRPRMAGSARRTPPRGAGRGPAACRRPRPARRSCVAGPPSRPGQC